MITHRVWYDVALWYIKNMWFSQEARANIETEVERFAVERLIVVTELCALVRVEDLLIDDAGGGQHSLTGKLGEFTGVVP